MASVYAPSNLLSGAPQLASGTTAPMSPFAPGTVFNQNGVVFPNSAPVATVSSAPMATGLFPPPVPISTGAMQSSVSSEAAPQILTGMGSSTPYQVQVSGQGLSPTTVSGPGYGLGFVPAVAVGTSALTTATPRPRSPRSERLTRPRSPRRELPVAAASSEGLSVSASELANKLLSRGVVMMDQIVVRDQNGQVAEQFIKGITQFGDKVLILLDQGQLPAPNVEGTLAGSSVLVPYSLKTSAHACSKSELCGVAFDCQGEICTMIRKKGSLDPQEITFKVAGEGRLQLPIGVVQVNDAVNAYPIVLWSEFWGISGLSDAETRAHKLLMLNYIDIVSQRINRDISRSVDGLLEKTVDAAQALRDKLAAIDIAVFHSVEKDGKLVSQGLRQDLEAAVNKLRAFNEGYQKLDSVPAEYLANFKTMETNLFHRKEYQRQLNTLMNTAVGYSDLINGISGRLDSVIEQIVRLKALNESKLKE